MNNQACQQGALINTGTGQAWVWFHFPRIRRITGTFLWHQGRCHYTSQIFLKVSGLRVTIPSDTDQFKGSPTSTVFDLTEHYPSLIMMEQRNKKPLQWKQQRGMAVKEVQTLWHQSCTSHWQTQRRSSLCSSSVPVTVSHPRVPPGTGRRQLHHRHPEPPTHVAPLKHQFKPVFALTSQVFFSKYVKQTLL